MENPKQFDDMEQMFRQALGDLPDGLVLDVATGQGGFIEAILENAPAVCHVVGVDPARGPLRTAQENLQGKPVSLTQMDGSCLAFPSASFETVVISAGLHHLPDIPAVLVEMLRVLRPGGVLLVAEMYSGGVTQAQRNMTALHQWAADVDTALGDTHNHTLGRDTIMGFFADMGLEERGLYGLIDQADPIDLELIEHIDGVIDNRLERLKNRPEYEAIASRAAGLKELIHEHGAQHEPVLVWVGSKKEF